MIMFLVMNTSGLILIPVSIMMYRSQMGAAQPTDIFIPTLITTAISTIVGVTAVSIAQRINLLNKPILILIGCISLFFSGLIYLFTQVSREEWAFTPRWLPTSFSLPSSCFSSCGDYGKD